MAGPPVAQPPRRGGKCELILAATAAGQNGWGEGLHLFPIISLIQPIIILY